MRPDALVLFVLATTVLTQDRVLSGLPAEGEAVAFQRLCFGDDFVTRSVPRRELPLGVVEANGDVLVLYEDEPRRLGSGPEGKQTAASLPGSATRGSLRWRSEPTRSSQR